MSQLSTAHSVVYYEDTLETHPEVTGKPVVIFLNGWALSCRYWKPVVDALTPDYRCITLDQSGTGRTKVVHNQHKFNIPVFADEASELIEKLGIAGDHNMHIIGHSMGSMVATELHHRYPNATASVTIIACGIFDYSWWQMQMLSWFVETSMNFKWLFFLGSFKEAFVEKATSQPIGEAFEKIIVEDFLNTDTEAAKQVGTLSLDKGALDLYTAQSVSIDAPLLLCVGIDDKTIPPDGMVTLYERRQGTAASPTTLIQYPGTGHLPMLENTEEFVKNLREHFSQSAQFARKPVEPIAANAKS
ncbi:alpha/beta hydrolase fold [Chloroherpeton thalassium ATCC 35110]|uniref:Alpha/beta hydrolase fold n=1 Tax=Chloroherpeton thalassium (strain ATCC 35110 / GB-78) TaxID=517418 RepID=B3QYF6_CHLT3|nr:alpha/beta hydrolase [Chloroherpeton thalassium]ACF13584.1 alpha/beta hydrolase fold [Chloroherpeton thalassium ATCC 35110]